MALTERLGRERLIFDGSMGTMLQNRGLAAGELPEIWNITRGETVAAIHREYARAGCDLFKTNTFGANRLKLAGSGYTAEQIITAGVSLAKAAAGGGVCVGLDIGPTGKLLAPLGGLGFEEAVDVFSEMAAAGTKAGADFILIETMNDAYEIKAAMLAAKENSDLPIFVTFTPDEAGRLLTGGDILTALCLIEGLGAAAVGINCGFGPERMKAMLPELNKYAGIPVIINPNAGLPELSGGQTVYNVTPEAFAAHMADAAASAQVLGGCCGTTPAHISAMVKACRDVPFAPSTPKTYTAVSSGRKAVMFGEKTVIIGERLNPTGKPRMKQALRDGALDYLYNEGLIQVEKGADILDVNAGLPDIDERAVLPRVVAGLQSVAAVPLQIDTADAAAAERALRLYNGKPLLNSVSGKEESLKTVLPLVKKYGAAVVALALDDNGIPETAEGRVKIAEKILAAAESHGISKKDVIVDALTLTISAGGDNARVTLEAVERIRGLGVHTILGVSNVSFGLPEREPINAAFFTLAMHRGLSAGIVNPLSGVMMDAYYAYNALSGADINFGRYIGRFSEHGANGQKTNKTAEAAGLYDSVINGLREQAAKAAAAMLADTPPLDIINGHLIPALDKVGQDFEKSKIFLPQLLMSAEAAKAAFEALKQHMQPGGGAGEKRGKIVLATVKGDIHDIGKNIVKILLENYNFDVIDLGKDVEPAVIVQAVVKERVRLVGLSALMTTTVINMEETIQLLRKEAPECHIMVGGAVLTKEYAEKIGADFYSKDAMSGVRYAEGLLKSRFI